MTRRNWLTFFGTCLLGVPFFRMAKAYAADVATQWWKTVAMDTLTAIHTRRSVRSFTGQPVADEQVNALLAAAMSAPSAGNEQPWEFIVITDKVTLEQVGKINKYAGFADKSPLAIMVCMNSKEEKFPGNGVLDTAAATQNMLLAAHAMGLGAVWTGVYPEQDRMDGFAALLGLPEHVQAMNLVVLGHPAKVASPQNRFNAGRVHAERW